MRRIAAALMLVMLAAAALPQAAHAVTPGAQHKLDPKRTGLAFEEVAFPSAGDSVRLRGWWFDGGAKAPVIVLCPHGSGTMADLLPSVREFAQRGYSVMTYDLREFGPGGPGAQDSLTNLIFASRWVDDTQGAFAYARARATGRFVFGWGQDLGSALVVATGARDHNLVDAIVCEGLFRTVQEQLLWNGTAQLPDVARRHRILVDGPDEPLSAVQRLYVPLMVVIAMKDDVTPPKVTRQVATHSLTRIDRYELPAATHVGAELQPGYFDRVAGWFKEIGALLPPPAAPATPAEPAKP